MATLPYRRFDASREPLCPKLLTVGRPNVGDFEKFVARAKGAWESRWLTNNGPLLREFEGKLRQLFGVKHAVLVCNACIGLNVVLRSLDLPEGGEIIVPSFTFVSTAHSCHSAGFKVKFCDCDPVSHCADVDSIAAAVGPETAAICAVNVWGAPCDFEGIQRVADKYDLKVVYDSAHAFGASFAGTMCGSKGNAEVFSLHATKAMNAGEGGVITTNDDALAKRVAFYRNFAFAGYDNVIGYGMNAKMSEFHAAVGLTNLENMPHVLAVNHRNFLAYKERLATIPGIVFYDHDAINPAAAVATTGEVVGSNYHYLVAEIDAQVFGLTRNELVEILHQENILARRYFYPGVHCFEPYKVMDPRAAERCPKTLAVAERVMTLPTGTAVSVADIETICGLLRRVHEDRAALSQAFRLGPPAPAEARPSWPAKAPAAAAPVPAHKVTKPAMEVGTKIGEAVMPPLPLSSSSTTTSSSSSSSSTRAPRRSPTAYRVYNVLVFPCASGIGLEIADALRGVKEVRLFGATSVSREPHHGGHVYARVYEGLPLIKDAACLPALLRVVAAEKIDAIFAGYDDAITFLTRPKNRAQLAAAGSTVMHPDSATCVTCRTKSLSYAALRDLIRCPRVLILPAEASRLTLPQAEARALDFPVFVKPDSGQGSHGAKRIDSNAQLVEHCGEIRDPLVCEYLPGPEYTVDCFSHRVGGLLFARPRERARVRNGLSVATRPSDVPGVFEMARAIQKRLHMRGAWFFQVKINAAGEPSLLEVAPRIAGAMAMHRNMGVNFPLLTVFEAMLPRSTPMRVHINECIEIEIMDKAYVNRFKWHVVDAERREQVASSTSSTSSTSKAVTRDGRKYQAVYVDLDDTLVLRGQSNTQLVRFLYQCVNRKRLLVLVTRSARDPMTVLREHKLQALFDDVLHVTQRSERKSAYVARHLGDPKTRGRLVPGLPAGVPLRGIFIDDSFRERIDVAKVSGIVGVFDCSMLAVLMDDVDVVDEVLDPQR